MGLRVFLLGRFEVEHDGVPIPKEAWRRRRPADLLKRVALAPGHSLAREQLIDALWPDKDPQTGANNLHRALHDLRQVMGGKYVAPDKGVVRMDPEVWVDVTAFEEQAARGDPAALAAAVGHYRGDLRPDDPYGDLLDGFRRTLRERFVDVALRLARHALTTGDDTAAVDVLRRLLVIDAAQEEAHRGLMQALARSGRRAEALAQFDACVEALGALGVAPSAQTVAAHRLLAKSETVPPKPAARDAPWTRVARRLLGTSELSSLRGRDDQLRALADFSSAANGTLWLVGEAGVGKTRLAFEAARLASERGAEVLSGVCLGDDSANVAYAPFIEMWADHLRVRGEATTNNPFFAVAKETSSNKDAQADHLRLFEAVHRAFDLLGTPSSTLIILDDIQFADRSTLDLCQYLARASRTRSRSILVTCRTDGLTVGTPAHTLFTGLLKQRLARRIVIDRLGEEDTRALLGDILEEAPAEALAHSVYEMTGGNAFYTEEVARAVLEGGEAADLVSEDLAETVRERVARLGNEAESLLVAASAMGQRFAFEVAAVVAGVALPVALEALDKALLAHVVEEVEGGYSFRHRLVRESLYRALTRARRAHLHARTAEALEARGAHHDQLAWHWREAGAPERAHTHLVAAGDHAADRVGLREAATLYEEALAALPGDRASPGPGRFHLLVKLGRLHVVLSDLERAVARFDEALALGIDGGYRPDAGERARARLGAALASMAGGRLTAAGDRLDAATRELGGPDSAHADAPALFYSLALLRWSEGRFADALGFAQRSLEEARRHGDVRAEARAHEALVLACHATGDLRAGVENETKRQALVGPTLDVAELSDAHLYFWDLHLHDGASRLHARQLLDTTERRARALGAQRVVALCRCVGGTLELYAGRWAAAESLLREAYALYRTLAVPSGQAVSLQRLALVLVATGRLEDARLAISDGVFIAQASTMQAHVLVLLYAALAHAELAAGDLDAASEAIREAQAASAAHGLCASCTLDVEHARARLALASDRLDDAQRTADDLESAAERLGNASYRAVARLTRARIGVRRAAGDAQTRADYRAASDAYAEVGCLADAAAVDAEALALGGSSFS